MSEPKSGQSRFFDDMSKLMTNAMGVAQGARDEAETAFKGWVDRWLADRDFVTREEFEAVREMAIKARTENTELRARLDRLDPQGAATGGRTMSDQDRKTDETGGMEFAPFKPFPPMGGDGQTQRQSGGGDQSQSQSSTRPGEDTRCPPMQRRTFPDTRTSSARSRRRDPSRERCGND